MTDTMQALHVTQLGDLVVVVDCRAHRVATARIPQAGRRRRPAANVPDRSRPDGRAHD